MALHPGNPARRFPRPRGADDPHPAARWHSGTPGHPGSPRSSGPPRPRRRAHPRTLPPLPLVLHPNCHSHLRRPPSPRHRPRRLQRRLHAPEARQLPRRRLQPPQYFLRPRSLPSAPSPAASHSAPSLSPGSGKPAALFFQQPSPSPPPRPTPPPTPARRPASSLIIIGFATVAAILEQLPPPPSPPRSSVSAAWPASSQSRSPPSACSAPPPPAGPTPPSPPRPSPPSPTLKSSSPASPQARISGSSFSWPSPRLASHRQSLPLHSSSASQPPHPRHLPGRACDSPPRRHLLGTEPP